MSSSAASSSSTASSASGVPAGARVPLTRYRRAELEAVESSVVDAVLATAMRLSDSSFKPELLAFLDWSRQGGRDSRRPVSCLRLVAHLAKTLRQFFVPYFVHLLQLCLQLLGGEGVARSYGGDERRLLKRHVLTALRCCFQYDEEGFMTKERYNGVVEPLVQELERDAAEEDEVAPEDAEAFVARMRDEVRPALVQLAACTDDEDRWKTLNAAVLEKTRHPDPAVRRAALLVVQGFYEQLGEDFLGLLPESVLYLAELLEDDDSAVEKTCRDVVATIEKHLGEPLSKYF